MKKIEELEELILLMLLKEGYIQGVGKWGFNVIIDSSWKHKTLKVYFFEDDEKYESYSITKMNFNEMIEEAIKHFRG